MKPSILFFFIILFVLPLSLSEQIQAQKLAVKSDVLQLTAMTPNLSLEMVSGEKSSLVLGAFGNYKPYNKNIKMIGVQPEYRFWFNGRPLIREYVGIGALLCSYDINWGEHIYKGDAGGIGITFGYSLVLGKRLNMEFYGSVGAVYYRQKQYYSNDNYLDYYNGKYINARGYTLIPVKVGISLSYIIK